MEKNHRVLVVMVRCLDYDRNKVKAAVIRGMELIGGPTVFAQPGENILLKPNLLAPDLPERCVTTHPEVFRAVAEEFIATGARVCYGDSPAMGGTERTARKAGLWQVAEELGINLADFKNSVEVQFSAGRQNKRFTIARGVIESDGLISISKLKTHGLTRMTGAIKNQFGCIPGVLKGEFHVKVPDIEGFSRMLVDLNLFLKPRLYIMDAIIAMEGNGPRGGKPRPVGWLLFSRDPVALDATACRLSGIPVQEVSPLKWGMEMGLGTFDEQEIELGGDIEEATRIVKLEVGAGSLRVPANLKKLRNHITTRPVIKSEECIKCGLCVKMCPVKPGAVNWRTGDTKSIPVYNYDRCIRCYCCQEICPEGAIELKTPLLGRVLSPLRH